MNRLKPDKSWQSRYNSARLVAVCYTLILLIEVISFRRHKEPYHWNLVVFSAVWAYFLGYGWRTRKKVLEERKALAAGHPVRTGPTFLWQAVLILLPVLALTGLGFYYLEQDRTMAEQEARERAKVTAERLAETFNNTGSQILRDYKNANFELNAEWSSDLGLSGWGGGAKTAAEVWQRIKAWQAANPDIQLADMPAADCRVGTTTGFSEPKPYPVAPLPPGWVEKLSPEQQRLWQAVETAEFTQTNLAAAETAITNFLTSRPGTDARINAQYHLLRLQARNRPVAESLELLADAPWGWGDKFTETGLPISQVLCQQALRLLPDGSGLPYHTGNPFKLPHKIAWAIEYAPSTFSPRLIAEVERVAGCTGTNHDAFAAGLQGWWNANEQARLVLAAFREQYPTNDWTQALDWVSTPNGRFLLAFGDQPYQVPTNNPALAEETNPTAIYPVQIYPEAVVVKALAAVMATNDIPVPAYAAARLEIGGHDLTLQSDKLLPANKAAKLPVLGEAPGSLERLFYGTNGPAFRIQILLADQGGLYAHQRQRTMMFGGLILASALAAVAGLIAAYRAFRRQQELNELKSNFVSSVSHELRAPIASVRLMAENLEGGKVAGTAKQNEYFHFIVQECRRLSSLIENVLDFSRIEQGRKQYEFEPVNVAALVRQTVMLLEPYAAEKGVSLRMEGATALELEADGQALQQALVNLIDNAVKHSPPGAAVTVGLAGAEAAGTMARLWVADAGPGIPAAEHGKIFERFYRRGSELRRETQGVGIGLSIVKHIVEAHGGRVRVESAPGRGSRFTLELPADGRGRQKLKATS